MTGNNELSIPMFPQYIVDQNNEGKLSLRRERGLGFIQ